MWELMMETATLGILSYIILDVFRCLAGLTIGFAFAGAGISIADKFIEGSGNEFPSENVMAFVIATSFLMGVLLPEWIIRGTILVT